MSRATPGAPGRSPLDAWLAGRLSLAGDAPDQAALDAWHLAGLRRTIAHARAKSPFYAAKLAHLGPDFPALLSDLAACPTTRPGELSRDHRPFVCVPLGEVEHMTTLRTSGTTGAAKRLAFTAADLEATLDFFHHGMATFTGPGDTVLIVLPAPRVAALLTSALDRLGARGLAGSLLAGEPERDGTIGPARDPVTALCRDVALARPRVLVAAPSQLSLFAHSPDACDAVRGRLTAVLASGEPLAAGVRRVVETRFGCPVFDHYGLTETGFGGGVECSAHRGYHLREADVYVEVCDPVTAAPLPEGEPGEVVVTTLDRQAMPLVRYATGDAAVMLPGPCPCGSPLRRLGPVSGRIDFQGQIVVPRKGGFGAS